MDAQSQTQDTAALVALTQARARFESTEGTEPPTDTGVEEALQENRFLAARDGMDAALTPRTARTLPPARPRRPRGPRRRCARP